MAVVALRRASALRKDLRDVSGCNRVLWRGQMTRKSEWVRGCKACPMSRWVLCALGVGRWCRGLACTACRAHGDESPRLKGAPSRFLWRDAGG